MSEGLARAYGKRGRTSGLQTPQQHRACAWSHEEPRVRPHGAARAAQGPRRLSAPRHHPQYHMGNQPPPSAARLKQCKPYAAKCSTEPRAAKNDSAAAYRFYRNAKNLQARRFAPRNDGFKIGELPSIRLHIVLGDDRIGREPLVHKTLFLQPAYLVADIFDVELAVGIDIGAVADHLLDRQIGVFGD